MSILRQAYLMCTSFDGYVAVAYQKHRHSLLYFLAVLSVAGFMIFPPYFYQKIRAMDPALLQLAQIFPPLEFKNHVLQFEPDEPLIIRDPQVAVVVDPGGRFRNDVLFHTPWLLFRKHTAQLHLGDQSLEIMRYSDPLVASLLIRLAGFREGTGVLEGAFFTGFKELLVEHLLVMGLFFILFFMVSGFLSHALFTVVNYLYSQILQTSLTWKAVRNISYYSMTPALVFLVLLNWMPLPAASLRGMTYLLIMLYFLFSMGAIRRFRPVREKEVTDEEEFF